MLPLLLLALAAPPAAPAAAAPAGPKVERVLVLETHADAAYVAKVRAFGDLLATVLEQRTSAEIVPSSSVKDRLAVAADKLSAGCDETACMSEIAGALDARWVVASRASQVGGRWLMRVELFDSQSLKVTAQVSTMSDSVEGLASQAEHMADDLIAKAPVLQKHAESDSSTSTTTSTTTTTTAPPDEAPKKSVLPWVVAAGGAGLAVVLVSAGSLSYFYSLGKQDDLTNALTAYQNEDTAAHRKALAEAGRAADDASTVNNCLLVPLGCLSIPLAAAAVGGGVYWGVTDKGEPATE